MSATIASNIFFVGHSLVSETLPNMLNSLIDAQRGSGQVDYQLINGAPLGYNWQNGASAQGMNARTALASGRYDVLVLTEAVPLDSQIAYWDSKGNALNYYRAAIAGNPDAQVYMYETWHDLRSGTGVDVPYDEGDGRSWRARIEADIAKWEGIVDHVNANRPEGAKAMLLVPVGQAMLNLMDAIDARQVPGITSIQQLFGDSIHPNSLGFYFVAMVQYATIFGVNPADLPTATFNQFGGAYQAPGAALADALQAIAWATVNEYDRDGVNDGAPSGGGVTTPPVDGGTGGTDTPDGGGDNAGGTDGGSGTDGGTGGNTGGSDGGTGSGASGAQGWAASYFTTASGITALSQIDFTRSPTATGTVDTLDFRGQHGALWTGGPVDNIAAVFKGNLAVESGGSYRFQLNSDDGSALYIDGKRVIDNDGAHADTAKSGTITLTAGNHAIEVRYFDGRYGATLQLQWQGPDSGNKLEVLGGESVTRPGSSTGGGVKPTPTDPTPTDPTPTDPTPTDPKPTDPVGGHDGSGDLVNPSVAVGLNGVNDWSTQQPFLDVFKTAREWTGHLPGQYGGVTYAQLQTRGLLDANGWPTEIPAGISHIGTVILTDLPAAMTSATGTYRLTYDGEGELRINGASNIRYGDGIVTFDYKPTGSGAVFIDIMATDPADHLRNISVVHADNAAAFAAGEVFDPDFLGKIDDMRALRFMDWMRTNDSSQSAWANRPEQSDFSWGTGAGVPLSVMVELANETGTDPWFNIPHLATADYMRKFVTYVRDNLDPDLKANFEFSNEVWNWQFGQAQWAHAQGQAAWPGEASAWVQYYAKKSVEMARIVDEVFGSQADDRAVKIIATQTGYLGIEDAILEAGRVTAEDPGHAQPASYFDTYAVTGYFDGGLGRGDKPAVVKQWLTDSRSMAVEAANDAGLTGDTRTRFIEAHKYDLAGALAVQELRDGSITGDPTGSLQELFSQFAYHKQVADDHGLKMVMYEGGSHVVGIGANMNDTALTDFFVWLNHSDAMGPLYTELMQGWKAAGGTLFNAFTDIGTPSKYGSWGSLAHIDDESARWDALMKFNEDNPGWWEDRGATDFADGGNPPVTSPVVPPTAPPVTTPEPPTVPPVTTPVTPTVPPATTPQPPAAPSKPTPLVLTGTDAAETLRGGMGDDRISAMAGNDTVFAGGGDDRVMGGFGADFLRGGVGTDTLTGGKGRDTFSALAGTGIDIITDFDSGVDFLRIDGRQIDLFARPPAGVRIASLGDDLVVTFNNGADKVVLQGHGQTGADEFLF